MQVALRYRGSLAVVVLSALFVEALLTSGARAACNTIPLGPPGRQYFGWLGTINRPFASPDEQIQILRRGCDEGEPFVPAQPAPRTLLAVDSKAPKAAPEIVIVESDAVGCTAAIVEQCKKSVAAHGLPAADVRCVALPAAEYGVDANGALLLSVPGKRKLGFEPATGAMAIAATRPALSPPCGLLLAQKCNTLTSANAKDWHACIDRLYAADPACQRADLDATFSTVTRLPPWNDYRALCFAEAACAENAPELGYTIDAQGNFVVPVNWEKLLKKCGHPAKRCGFEVLGDFMPPPGMRLSVPDNDQGVDKNVFLESFNADGISEGPLFVSRNTLPGAAGFRGKADEPFSVLRLRQHRGQCFDGQGSATGARCSIPGKPCKSGATCRPVCVGGGMKGTPCTVDADCNGGSCGSSHELVKAHRKGRWWLDRDDGAFCRRNPDPARTCSRPNGCATACVRYQAIARNPFVVPTPTANLTARPTPTSKAFVETEALEGALLALVPGATETLFFASTLDGLRLAAFVETSQQGGPAKTSLVIASTQCAHGELVCSPLDVHIDRPPLGLAFVGNQLRFLLAVDAPAPAATSASGDAPALADLQVIDVERGVAAHSLTATQVSRVVVDDDRYDPLGEQPNGATLLLSPAGRCYAPQGLLSVPSYCRPGVAGDCPDEAECRPELIAVAVDLRADEDADGVPDVVAGAGR